MGTVSSGADTRHLSRRELVLLLQKKGKRKRMWRRTQDFWPQNHWLESTVSK